MKGVSPVVAILLLTVITLAIAGMTYITYTGIADVATKSDNKLPESFKVVSTSENMVYLKNTGPEAIDVPLFFTEDGPVDATRGCELLEPDEICGYGLDIDYGVHEVTIGGESSEKTILYVGVEKPRLDVPITIARPPTVASPPRVIPTTTVPRSTTTTTTTTTVAATSRRVFVTSATYHGNLGGLAGGDAECQSLANAASLGGIWKAWLSDSSTNAIDRILDAVYKNMNGDIVINKKSDITSDGRITAAIAKDERNNALTGSNGIWTGTDNYGVKNDYRCVDWTGTLNSDNGMAGFATENGARWSFVIENQCSSGGPPLHLYCFEVTASPA
ncbi:MAG TPA: DUF1554 domain-containing protein, partial [archaeon]|nr:DUF1554 domain-containing protein [archaeon]